MKRAQDNVFRMLSGVNSLDELNENQKIDVSNSLDEIKAILLANEGNRLICYRETQDRHQPADQALRDLCGSRSPRPRIAACDARHQPSCTDQKRRLTSAAMSMMPR